MTNSTDPRKGDPLDPAGPISGTGGAKVSPVSPQGAEAVDSADSAVAVEDALTTEAVAGGSEIDPTGPIGPEALHGIAQAVASGAIDTGEARARLIEAVVGAHLPPDVDPATEASLRAEVEELLADDPTLAVLLKPSMG